MSSTQPLTHTTQEQEQPRSSLWRNRDFVLLWSGQVVSTLGTRISTLALPLLVLALTHSPAQTGLVAAIQSLPYLLFGLPAGTFIDRWNRKTAMISCDLVRWLVLGTIPIAFVLGRLSMPQLYTAAFVEGTASMLFGLTQVSSIPRVVSARHIPQANALNELSESTASLLGPALGGLIIRLANSTISGAMIAYLVDSLSYLVSALSLRLIRVPFQAERVRAAGRVTWHDLAAGLHFLWQQRLLRIMVLLTMTVNFLQRLLTLVIIVFAQHLHIDDPTIALIVSLGGSGGLVGGFCALWLSSRLRFGQIIIGSVLIWTLAALLCALASSALLLIAGGILMNLMWPVYGVALISYRQSLAPDRLQGRVNSAFRWLSFGSESLGAASIGLLLLWLTPQNVLWLVTGGLAVSVAVVSCTALRRA